MAKTVNFEGKTYNFPDEASMDEIHGYLRKVAGIEQQPVEVPQVAPPPPADMSYWESLKRGAANTTSGTMESLGFNDPGEFEQAHKRYLESANINPLMTGLGGMAPILPAAGVSMLAAPVTGPAAAITLGALAGGGVAGTSEYQNVLADTNNREAAMKAGLTTGGTTAVGFAIPASLGGRVAAKVGLGGGIGGRAAEGAVANLGFNEVDTAIRNKVLQDYPDLQREHFDPSSMAVAGVMGAGFGAMSPKYVPSAARTKLPTTDTFNAPPDISVATQEQVKILTTQIDGKKSYIASKQDELDKLLASPKKQPEWKIERLQDEIDSANGDLALHEADLDTANRGGKKPSTAEVDLAEEARVQYITAKRKSDQAGRDWYGANEKDMPESAGVNREQYKKLIEDTKAKEAVWNDLKKKQTLIDEGFTEGDMDLLSFRIKETTSNTHNAFNAMAGRGGIKTASNNALKKVIAELADKLNNKNVGKGTYRKNLENELGQLKAELNSRPPEAPSVTPKTQNVVTPTKATPEGIVAPPEAPMTLAEKGKASSIYAGEGATSEKIKAFFDPELVATHKVEIIEGMIAGKRAKLQTEKSSRVRGNIAEEIAIAEDILAKRKAGWTEQEIIADLRQGERQPTVRTDSKPVNKPVDLFPNDEDLYTAMEGNRETATEVALSNRKIDKAVAPLRAEAEKIKQKAEDRNPSSRFPDFTLKERLRLDEIGDEIAVESLKISPRGQLTAIKEDLLNQLDNFREFGDPSDPYQIARKPVIIELLKKVERFEELARKGEGVQTKLPESSVRQEQQTRGSEPQGELPQPTRADTSLGTTIRYSDWEDIGQGYSARSSSTHPMQDIKTPDGNIITRGLETTGEEYWEFEMGHNPLSRGGMDWVDAAMADIRGLSLPKLKGQMGRVGDQPTRADTSLDTYMANEARIAELQDERASLITTDKNGVERRPRTGTDERRIVDSIDDELDRLNIEQARIEVGNNELNSIAASGGIKAISFVKNKLVVFSQKEWSKLTPQERKALDMHEVGAHIAANLKYGAEYMADRLNELRNALYEGNKVVKAAYDKIPRDTPPHLRDTEALGYLLENHYNLPVVQRIFREVIGYAKSVMGMDATPEKLIKLVKGAHKEFADQIRLKFVPEITDKVQPGEVLLDVERSFTQSPFELSIVRSLHGIAQLGGSAALVLQGVKLFRKSPLLHDLDMVVSSNSAKVTAYRTIKELYPNAEILSDISNRKAIAIGIPRDPKDRIGSLSRKAADNTIIKNTGEVVPGVIGENLVIVDIFVNSANGKKPVTITVNGERIPLVVADKEGIFDAKLNYAREKDVNDFARSGTEDALYSKTEEQPSRGSVIAANNIAKIRAVQQGRRTVALDTQDTLLEAIQTGSIEDVGKAVSEVSVRAFGKLQITEIANNRVVDFVNGVVSKAEATKVKVSNTAKYGYDATKTIVGKRFISAKRYITDNSVYKTFHDLTDEMGFTLHKINQQFFDENVTVDSIKAEMKANKVEGDDWFNYHLNKRVEQLQSTGVNQKVIDAYVAEKKALRTVFEHTNSELELQGRTKETARPDYFPAVRKGKYQVNVLANDLLYRVEIFRTEMEAKLYQEKMQAYPQYKTQFEDLNLQAESKYGVDDIAEMNKFFLPRIGIDPNSPIVNLVLDQMSTTGMKFGMHQKYRKGLGGYEGSAWFKSDKELGSAYRHAIFDWIDEQMAINTKQNIKFNTQRLLEGEGFVMEKALPNATSLARQIRDAGMNKTPEWGWSKVFDKFVRDVGDKLVYNVAKMFGKEYIAKISPTDKFLGVMSNMFYMTTLMARPGFWASQVLTAPTSLRHILRDTGIPLADIAKSFSKGSARSFGFIPYDNISGPAMQRQMDNFTTLRPQLTNEMNTFNFMDIGAHKKLATLLRAITGQSPSEAADVFSRIWTANMMIEHYVGIGLRGKELDDAVANAVDITMVAYNRSNKARWVDQAGIVGQAANPLMTFGTAQLGNLVADIRYMAQEGTLRSALPAISTMLVTQLMAGAIGLPILVEYQFLRDLIVGYDEEYDWMPNPKEILMNSPEWVERGIPSAATGFDIGSGMRWNPFLAKFLMEDNKSVLDAFPAIAFVGSVATAAGMSLHGMVGGEYTQAEQRKAMLQVTPFVAGKGIFDDVSFDATTRPMVPDSRGAGLVEQTGKERLSTYIGSSTLERADASNRNYMLGQLNKIASAKQMSNIQKLVDGKFTQSALTALAEAGINGERISNLVNESVKKRSLSAADRALLELISGEMTVTKIKNWQRAYGSM